MIKELRRENDHLRNSVEHVVNTNKTFHNQVTDLRCRSLQNNLLFIKVEEKRAQNSDNTNSVENCEQTLREFIRLNVQNDPHLNTNDFNIDEIQFSKVRRIGGPDAKTRPIVATFQSYRDRESLRQAGVNLYLKLFVLLYADDTIIRSESAADSQKSPNAYSEYCKLWKLTVNSSKTKILILSSGKQLRIL